MQSLARNAPAIRDDVKATASLGAWFECVCTAKQAVCNVVNVCERDVVVASPKDPKFATVTPDQSSLSDDPYSTERVQCCTHLLAVSNIAGRKSVSVGPYT